MNEPELTVTICTGTTCYIMGGSHLLMLQETLPEELRSRVRLEGCPCMGHCRDSGEEGATPCVRINGETLSGLSLQELTDEIRSRLEDSDNA